MPPASPELLAYLAELERQSQSFARELDALADIAAAQGELASRDGFAAERLLQVLTEACIGVAKHWVKQQGHTAPADAYQAFAAMADGGMACAKPLTEWKKIIGLRNALVHDYLNLDRDVVLAVLQQHAYRKLSRFIHEAAEAIRQNR